MENAASICLMAADTAFLHTVFGFGALACPFVSCSRARLGRHRAETQFSACQISGAGSNFGARVEVRTRQPKPNCQSLSALTYLIVPG